VFLRIVWTLLEVCSQHPSVSLVSHTDLCGDSWLNPTSTASKKEQKFIKTNAAITINIQLFKQLLDNLEQ
jgi:hypothetical protein